MGGEEEKTPLPQVGEGAPKGWERARRWRFTVIFHPPRRSDIPVQQVRLIEEKRDFNRPMSGIPLPDLHLIPETPEKALKNEEFR